MAPPDCHKVPMRAPDAQGNPLLTDAYYCRLQVVNKGNRAARNVEVYAKSLSRLRLDGQWEEVETFIPMNLLWAHMGNQIFFPRIGPGVPKHCGLFHVVNPKDRYRISGEATKNDSANQTDAVISFDLMAKSFALGHLVPKGTYKMAVVAAADNARSVENSYTIKIDGLWSDDEEKMLSQLIAIEQVD